MNYKRVANKIAPRNESYEAIEVIPVKLVLNKDSDLSLKISSLWQWFIISANFRL